ISTTNNNEQQLIFIAVEHNNRKRHFLSVTFDELSKLLHCLEPPKLTLYEILCRNNSYSNGFYQWIFDLHVYNKNQQFRLYKATKFGKHNPLLTTSSFSFNGQNERKNEMLIDKTINYDSILSHALISYTVNNTNLLIFSFNENKWSLLDQHENRIVDLTTKTYFTTLIISKTSPNETNALKRIPPTNTTDLANNTDHFKSFITNLITKIYHTNAYIRSCQRGTNNPSLLFYNIGGEFRFCERLQRHHQSNNTCIIVDTSTCKYQIKCKDPDCKNFKPPWKHIS
ncbi:unnamed protein product, partial [Rotaria socialis]